MENDHEKNRLTGDRAEFMRHIADKGLEGMDDANIIEAVLYYSRCSKDVRGKAEALLERFGSLMGVFAAEPSALLDSGLTDGAAVLMKIIYDFYPEYAAESMKTSDGAIDAPYLKELFRIYFIGKRTEEFRAVSFDKNLNMTAEKKLSEGISSFSEVNAHSLVKFLLDEKAAAAAVGHNHPDSECIPSDADIRLTDKLALVMNSLGIVFLDHIIVGSEKCYSFRENGGIPLFIGLQKY